MKSKRLACDVLVVGAGICGVAAAISASRSGARTILIEARDSVGGIAASARHRYICGLYPKNTGLAKEIILGLQKLRLQNKFTQLGKLPVFYFQPEDLNLILLQLIKKEKNLKVIYNSTVTKVNRKGSSIFSLEARSKALCLNLLPKLVIDASGNGSVIKLSKAKSKLPPLSDRQLAGFTFELKGLRDTSGLLPIKVPYALSSAVKQKKFPGHFKFTNFAYGQAKNSGIIKLNLPAKNTQPKTQETKKYTALIHAYLRKELPEFKKSRIHWVASAVFEREGLRLDGQHTLTEQEVLSARKFPDAIAKGYWPIEFWHPKLGQQIKYLKPGKFYEIPLSCLKSKNVTNLLATGKCISATSAALASCRVMGTCIYLGEAAGRAAAR